jgi:predicted nuclease of predicted toxin-antitoxin system
MKLLGDMNLSPRRVDYLEVAGHVDTHWSMVGSQNAPDERQMEWAQENDHILLTYDLDFGTTLVAQRAAHPSVIQIRSDDLNRKKAVWYLLMCWKGFRLSFRLVH